METTSNKPSFWQRIFGGGKRVGTEGLGTEPGVDTEPGSVSTRASRVSTRFASFLSFIKIPLLKTGEWVLGR